MQNNARVLGSLFIGLIIGASGYAALFPNGSMSQSSDMNMSESMEHPQTEIDANGPVPSVAVSASKDTMSGYNIKVQLTNFALTPEKVGSAATPREGHAHVFVNDKKIMRLYGEWAHLPAEVFKDGENTISVTLNANDHSEWTSGGEHIKASTVVTK